jgi:hypothetical protein
MVLYRSFFHTLFNDLECPVVIDNSEGFFHLICPEKLGGEILNGLVSSFLSKSFEPSRKEGRL